MTDQELFDIFSDNWKTPNELKEYFESLNHYELQKRGFRVWDYPEASKAIYLFPENYLELIPTGFEGVDLKGKKKLFILEEIQNLPVKYGCIEFGILVDISKFYE